MSSKRALRRRACKGKQRHDSREAAKFEVRRIVRTGHSRGYINAYPCQFCGGWHVGRRPGTKLPAPEVRR